MIALLLRLVYSAQPRGMCDTPWRRNGWVEKRVCVAEQFGKRRNQPTNVKPDFLTQPPTWMVVSINFRPFSAWAGARQLLFSATQTPRVEPGSPASGGAVAPATRSAACD